MEKQTDLKRRNFLLAAGAGSVAAAAAVVGGQAAIDAQHGGGTREKGRRGYQLSEHVRNYYRTARV